MSEHPPIPDELVGEYKLATQFTASARSELEQAARILWREWTRGKAVVPLPAPTDKNRWDLQHGLDVYADGDVPDSPAVWHRDRDYYADEARALAAALLAAADRAEQLAAEAAPSPSTNEPASRDQHEAGIERTETRIHD